MKTLKVGGMKCQHCKAAVEEAAGKTPGVRNPCADPATGELCYEESAPVNEEALKQAIRAIGFTA
jgi:copper chaperone CopZ